MISDVSQRSGTGTKLYNTYSQSLCLRNVKPDESGTNPDEDTEEDKCAIAHVSDHFWRNLANNEVVHPVRRSSKSDTIWTSRKRPDFGNDDPCTMKRVSQSVTLSGIWSNLPWTPRPAKVDDE